MKLKYLGHSCFYGEINNIKWIIDPFITENPNCPISIDDLEDITHIFITHGHSDHFGDTIELCKKFEPIVITNVEIASYLNFLEIPAFGMQIGGRHKFPFGTVKMTPAIHSSTIDTAQGNIYGGNPGGFIFTFDNFTIYHAGDTGLMTDMELFQEDNIDIMMVPIGGFYTMDLDDAVRAVELVKPKISIPMHYNTFDLIKADPDEFKLKNIFSKTIIMDFGQEIDI